MKTQPSLSIAAAIALVAVASCGAGGRASNQTKKEATMTHTTLTKLKLTSSAFQDGQPIPAQYSCDGADETPMLSWGEPPAGTKSFALVIDDPDAPSGTFSPLGRLRHSCVGAIDRGSHRIGTEVRTISASRATAAPARPRATVRIIITSSCSHSTLST